MFSDGHTEIITADNIEEYFNDQGHELSHIVGNQAFGKTIIDVEVYEADCPPVLVPVEITKERALAEKKPFHTFEDNDGDIHYVLQPHRSTLTRPAVMPTAQTLRTRLDTLGVQRGGA